MAENDGTVIDRFYAGLASGDLDTSLACLSADARIWHCFDGIAQDRQSSLAGWQDLVANFPCRAFGDIRRHSIPGGFVQQMMMTVRTASGAGFGWPICVVIKVADGLITRIDEYIDRAGRFELAAESDIATPGLEKS